MTIVYSCLCLVSISRGLMTKPVGFLRVPLLKFVEQIVWFFYFLISLLIGPFFSVCICIWFYLLQSNCNNGYSSRMNFVNFLKVNIFLSYLILLNLLWCTFSDFDCWMTLIRALLKPPTTDLTTNDQPTHRSLTIYSPTHRLAIVNLS